MVTIINIYLCATFFIGALVILATLSLIAIFLIEKFIQRAIRWGDKNTRAVILTALMRRK